MKKQIAVVCGVLLTSSLIATACGNAADNARNNTLNNNRPDIIGVDDNTRLTPPPGRANDAPGNFLTGNTWNRRARGLEVNDNNNANDLLRNVRIDRDLESRIHTIPGVRHSRVFVSDNSAFVLVDTTGVSSTTYGGYVGANNIGPNAQGNHQPSGRNDADVNREGTTRPGDRGGANATGADRRNGGIYGMTNMTGDVGDSMDNYNTDARGRIVDTGNNATGNNGNNNGQNRGNGGTMRARNDNTFATFDQDITNDMKRRIADEIRRDNSGIQNVFFVTPFR